jgi:hypothetical protein
MYLRNYQALRCEISLLYLLYTNSAGIGLVAFEHLR